MRKRRFANPPVNVPVASMGDIAFLLIIFFILCSNFAKRAGKEVTPPAAIQLLPLPSPRLYVAIDRNQRMFFQTKEVGSAKEIEAELGGVIDPNGSVEARTVIFECDKDVPKETYEPVLEAIAKANGIIGAVGKEAGADRSRR